MGKQRLNTDGSDVRGGAISEPLSSSASLRYSETMAGKLTERRSESRNVWGGTDRGMEDQCGVRKVAREIGWYSWGKHLSNESEQCLSPQTGRVSPKSERQQKDGFVNLQEPECDMEDAEPVWGSGGEEASMVHLAGG